MFSFFYAILFPSFKSSRITIVIIGTISMVMAFLLLGNMELTNEDVRELANMGINVCLVQTTLGITIFTLPLHTSSNERKKKKDIIMSYIGAMFRLIATAIMTYIITYVMDIGWLQIPEYVVRIFGVVLLLMLIQTLLETLKYIIKYFEVRE